MALFSTKNKYKTAKIRQLFHQFDMFSVSATAHAPIAYRHFKRCYQEDYGDSKDLYWGDHAGSLSPLL